jgi:hypothetical protein
MSKIVEMNSRDVVDLTLFNEESRVYLGYDP